MACSGRRLCGRSAGRRTWHIAAFPALLELLVLLEPVSLVVAPGTVPTTTDDGLPTGLPPCDVDGGERVSHALLYTHVRTRNPLVSYTRCSALGLLLGLFDVTILLQCYSLSLFVSCQRARYHRDRQAASRG